MSLAISTRSPSLGQPPPTRTVRLVTPRFSAKGRHELGLGSPSEPFVRFRRKLRLRFHLAYERFLRLDFEFFRFLHRSLFQTAFLPVNEYLWNRRISWNRVSFETFWSRVQGELAEQVEATRMMRRHLIGGRLAKKRSFYLDQLVPVH